MLVLVTGGAGFVGARVAALFRDAGWDVLVVDDLSHSYAARVPEAVRFFNIDIGSDEFPALVNRERPDLISHHAALTSVRDSFLKPKEDAQINALGTLAVLEAAVAAGVPRLIYASSIAVIGEPQWLPVGEDHPTRPLSPYGLSKLWGEQYVDLYARTNGLETTTLRYGNVYGVGQGLNGTAGVIQNFAQRMRAGDEVTIYGDGEQTRDFVYVDDVAVANLRAAESGAGGLFHIGSGAAVTVNQIFGMLAGLFDYDREPLHAEDLRGEIRDAVLDSSQARSVLGWTPETALCDGLPAIVEDMQAVSCALPEIYAAAPRVGGGTAAG